MPHSSPIELLIQSSNEQPTHNLYRWDINLVSPGAPWCCLDTHLWQIKAKARCWSVHRPESSWNGQLWFGEGCISPSTAPSRFQKYTDATHYGTGRVAGSIRESQVTDSQLLPCTNAECMLRIILVKLLLFFHLHTYYRRPITHQKVNRDVLLL